MDRRIQLLNMCSEFLNEKLSDENTPEIVKSEIIKKLYHIKPPNKNVVLSIDYKDKKYSQTISIKFKRSDYPELAKWKKAVLLRDNYTCQHCGRKKKLEAHHINSWADYPAERFDLSNGLTLCKKCHCKTNNYGNRSYAVC